MNDRKYVIASSDPEFIGPLAPGYLGDNVRYVSAFVTHPMRSKRFDEKGMLDSEVPRIHKSYTNNPLMATRLPLEDAKLICAVLNLVLNEKTGRYFAPVEVSEVASERHPVNCS